MIPKNCPQKKREALYDVIVKTAVAWGIGFATEAEIDKINILQATFLAMRRAVGKLSPKPDCALVDGNRMPQLGMETRTIVKGDSSFRQHCRGFHSCKSQQRSPYVPN
jgi:ribonuclease HII